MVKFIVSTLVVVFTLSAVFVGDVSADTSSADQAVTFSETFDSIGNSPVPFNTENWDITIHSRELPETKLLQMSEAQLNNDCNRYGDTHTIVAPEESVLSCGGKLLTSMRSDSYGVIYFTPDHMVDFSDGEAVIRWEMSTERTTSRDWIDIWVTPYEDNLQLTLDNWLPDLSGEARNSVHIAQDMSWNSTFRAEVYDGSFNRTELPFTQEGWQGYESVITPSFEELTVFELRISQNRIKFGMPEHDFWWYDTEVDLDWSEGVVQFGFHSYNPEKACDWDGSCRATTYQWDNIEISPAKPFDMVKSDRAWVDPNVDTTLEFEAPAPANAHLRFAGIGTDIEVSFDGGSNWQSAEFQAQRQDLFVDDHFKSYWMEVPAGTTSVTFRGQKWFNNDWMIKDATFWTPDVQITADTSVPTAVQMSSAAADAYNMTNNVWLLLAAATALTIATPMVILSREN